MRMKATLILSAAAALFLGSCRSAIQTLDKCDSDTVSIVIEAPDQDHVVVRPETAVVCKKQDILWASLSGELLEIKFEGNDMDDPSNPPPPNPICQLGSKKNKCELKKDKLKTGRFKYSVRGKAENGEEFYVDPVVIIEP